MRIKGWKKEEFNTNNRIEYYKRISEDVYASVGAYKLNNGKWKVIGDIPHRIVDTKEQALALVIDYMRSHPNGKSR